MATDDKKVREIWRGVFTPWGPNVTMRVLSVEYVDAYNKDRVALRVERYGKDLLGGDCWSELDEREPEIIEYVCVQLAKELGR